MSKHISCTATSVQLGSNRFPDRHDQPQIKAWRCDLTALSRSHNFYFVACNDTIHVYRPSFPDQSIPGEPELILHPPVSSPDLAPGIDYEDSHSITRLHVDYLGQDEIILITCDDGDVVGYRTEEIQRVLDKRAETDDEQELPSEEDVRTFLHRNMGSSAWGLAIHQEARMIAISANTHKVTVIAFALADPTETSDDSSDDSDMEGHPDEEDPADFPTPRRRDHVISLSARHNIPAIAFNNSGDDPSGRWLSSSSINGEAVIWDLHRPNEPARVIRVGFCASVKESTKAPKLMPGGCACLRPSNCPHAVWSTMFLDATTAYEDSPSDDWMMQSEPLEPCFQDVSKRKKRFTVGKPKALSQAMGVPPAEVESDGSGEMDISETESNISDDSESHSLPSPNFGGDYQQQFDEAAFEAADHALQEEIANSANAASLPPLSTGFGPPPSIQPPSTATGNAINAFGGWFQPPGQTAATIVWDNSDSDTEDEMGGPSISQLQMAYTSAIPPTRPYCEISTAPTFSTQPQISSPFLIVTKEDIYLFQRPLNPTGDLSDPITTLRRPLHPVEQLLMTASHDRHCYTTQIPELGVFVIASPNGRAGIFSLTKTAPASTYGFHLEYILPFSNEDENRVCDVQGARLVGVAAGPVQGMLDNEGGGGHASLRRRWRLLMYFSNHSVLAFELGRRRGEGMGEEMGVGVGELVV